MTQLTKAIGTEGYQPSASQSTIPQPSAPIPLLLQTTTTTTPKKRGRPADSKNKDKAGKGKGPAKYISPTNDDDADRGQHASPSQASSLYQRSGGILLSPRDSSGEPSSETCDNSAYEDIGNISYFDSARLFRHA